MVMMNANLLTVFGLTFLMKFSSPLATDFYVKDAGAIAEIVEIVQEITNHAVFLKAKYKPFVDVSLTCQDERGNKIVKHAPYRNILLENGDREAYCIGELTNDLENSENTKSTIHFIIEDIKKQRKMELVMKKGWPNGKYIIQDPFIPEIQVLNRSQLEYSSNGNIPFNVTILVPPGTSVDVSDVKFYVDLIVLEFTKLVKISTDSNLTDYGDFIEHASGDWHRSLEFILLMNKNVRRSGFIDFHAHYDWPESSVVKTTTMTQSRTFKAVSHDGVFPKIFVGFENPNETDTYTCRKETVCSITCVAYGIEIAGIYLVNALGAVTHYMENVTIETQPPYTVTLSADLLGPPKFVGTENYACSAHSYDDFAASKKFSVTYE